MVSGREKAVKFGEGNRRNDLSISDGAGGDAKVTITVSIAETVTTEKSISFTSEESSGFSLGVSFYVELGTNFNFSHSESHAKTDTTGKVTSPEEAIKLEAGQRCKINNDAFEVLYTEELDISIELSGMIAVVFDKKIQLNNTRQHEKIHFVPITTILTQLSRDNGWPFNVPCQINDDGVVLQAKAQHHFSLWRRSKKEKESIAGDRPSDQFTSNEDDIVWSRSVSS